LHIIPRVLVNVLSLGDSSQDVTDDKKIGGSLRAIVRIIPKVSPGASAALSNTKGDSSISLSMVSKSGKKGYRTAAVRVVVVALQQSA